MALRGKKQFKAEPLEANEAFLYLPVCCLLTITITNVNDNWPLGSLFDKGQQRKAKCYFLLTSWH